MQHDINVGQFQQIESLLRNIGYPGFQQGSPLGQAIAGKQGPVNPAAPAANFVGQAAVGQSPQPGEADAKMAIAKAFASLLGGGLGQQQAPMDISLGPLAVATQRTPMPMAQLFRR